MKKRKQDQDRTGSAENRKIAAGRDIVDSIVVSGNGNVITIGTRSDRTPTAGNRDIPRVFISSTQVDLKAHRDAARDAAIGADFLPVQMEYFAASGQYAPLQACMEKIGEADVLVVILARRYGWVPADQDGEEHKSITWLECERAASEGREVLAFILDSDCDWDEKLTESHRIAAAVTDGTATPELLAEVQRNVAKLKDFQEWLDGRGIRATFTTPEDLRWKVAEALRDWKQRNRPEPACSPGDPPPHRPTAPTFPPAYREWLKNRCSDVELTFRQKQGHSIRLRHVYVPLMTDPERDEVATSLVSPRRKSGEPGEENARPLLDELNERSLYVPGDPGTGKSTFCRWVAWLIAEGNLPTCEETTPQELRESFPDSLGRRLPLLVRLRDMWRYLPQDARRDTLSQSELESALSNWLDTTSPGKLCWDDVDRHLQAGSALLILDGVDEVPLRHGDGDAACYPRAALLAGLAESVAAWEEKGNRVLLTSRPYGLDDSQTARLPIRTARIRALDSPARELLVRRWFRCLKSDPETARGMAGDMLQHLAERTELSQLTENPMLLSSMCIIYDEGKRLPQDKHNLYERIVDSVLHNRYPNDNVELETARTHLTVIAHGMHTGTGLDQERTTPEAEVTHDDIERMLRTFHQQSAATYTGYRNALTTRDELLQRSGLLLSRGAKQAGFYHYTFQDFLAAQRIADIAPAGVFDVFRERARFAEWRSTLSFLFGSYSRERAPQLLSRLIESLDADSVNLAVVVADGIETLLGRGNRLREDVEQTFVRYCLEAISNEAEVKARHILGLALGRLGDPRVVLDLRGDAGYATIPAGEYAFQDGRQTIEQPFELSRYPVTNSQFAVFLQDSGYANRKHWSEEGWLWKESHAITQPLSWGNGKWNGLNQPVVGVSFYEAAAFCRWAGGLLPTEQQWEAAARGSDGLEYPWGNDWKDGICNSNEAGLRITSSVGLFPRSRSRDFELDDLGGNVWEWCDSWYDEDKTSRVLRGGSFYNLAHHVRSAFRSYIQPDNRWLINGFRVARTYR